ncbi:MAG: hypothetical protein ACP5Q4_02650 [Candidatus Caldatribacteriaceae bacterium]
MFTQRNSWLCFWTIVALCFFLSSTLHAKEFIDLFCTDVERKEAILTCAFQAGVEVVFLEEVEGRVNLRKDHVRFEEALSMILKGSGVSWFRADGVYYIGVPPSRDILPGASQSPERYNLKHRKSQEIIASLPQYRDILVTDGEYTVLILGNETLRRAVLERIKALDTPKTHILVKALVVECKKKEAKKLGLAPLKNGQSITVGEVNLGGPFERLDTLKVYLEDLEEEGKLRLRSEMEVLVLEGEEGEVSTTGEVYYPTGEERGLRKVDSGTTLKVLPRRVERNTIQMDVALTVKDLEQAGRSDFAVVKRAAQTSITLKEGAVVAITGLKQEEEGETRRRVSRRRTSSRKDKTELIVLLQADEQEPSMLETIASVENTRGKIIIPEFDYDYEYHLLFSYASLGGSGDFPPWLGIAFSGQDKASPWQLEGKLLLSSAVQGKGEVTLRYPMEDHAYFALRWSRLWGETSSTVYSLYLGERGSLSPDINWHAGIGAHLSGSQELSFAFLEFSGQTRDLSLRAGLLYQWCRATHNLWLEAEERLALSRCSSLFIGHRRCILGKPVNPFDETFFNGLYAGILFKL